jgi:hypothetical protein
MKTQSESVRPNFPFMESFVQALFRHRTDVYSKLEFESLFSQLFPCP